MSLGSIDEQTGVSVAAETLVIVGLSVRPGLLPLDA